MDVDRDVSPATLNNCRETTSAIFSFRTDEQNGRQSVRTNAAVLRTDTFSWRTDGKTVRTDVAILRTDANVFRTDMQTVRTVCRTLLTDFF